MRIITTAERTEMECVIIDILSESVSAEYAKNILWHDVASDASKVMDEIIQDICVSSEWETTGYYNDDDVRLAIGRVLSKYIGVKF